MASTNPPTPYAASPSNPAPLEDTIQALRRLINSDLSKDEILLMSKLSAVFVSKVVDVFRNEDRSAVDQLVGSLEGHPESTLGILIDGVANERNEIARSGSLNPPRSSIDNTFPATTATPFATHHLQLPINLTRSASTRTRSVSSRGSTSTNITHPSYKVNKKRPVGQIRRQFYCPDCGKDKKNGFVPHFTVHIEHLVAPNIGENDAIGCGYCPAHGLLAHGGKVFHGPKRFAEHVKEEHGSSKTRLHWDFNASFNHILSAQQLFRRNILQKINQATGPRTVADNSFLTLSWSYSVLTCQLLRELQTISGKITLRQALYTDADLDPLLSRVYAAAAHKWQPLAEFSDLPGRDAVRGPVIPPLAIRPPTTRPSQDAMDFAHMGQNFPDIPTPKYAAEIVPPSSAVSPRTRGTPAQGRGPFVQPGAAAGGAAATSFHGTLPVRHAEAGVIAFDGCAGFAGGEGAASPVGLPKEESFESFCSSVWGIQDSDLYPGQM